MMIMTRGQNTRLTDQETVQLGAAYEQLVHLSPAARSSNQLTEPTEDAIDLLPKRWKRRVDRKFGSNTTRDLIRDLTFEQADMGKKLHPVEGC